MSESFDDALVTVHKYRLLSGKMCNRLQRAHEHELEQARKAEYHRGFEDGQRSMDAEHRAVCHKLRRVMLDGDSHTMLSRLAYAIYPCATGWTGESCEGLREQIIELLGGVHEPVSVRVSGGACADGCRDSHGQSEAVDVDELRNERDELRKSLRKIADHVGVPHDRDLSDYSDEVIVNAAIRQLGQMNQYVKSLEWVRDRRLPKIEAERDELQKKLDAIREMLDE